VINRPGRIKYDPETETCDGLHAKLKGLEKLDYYICALVAENDFEGGRVGSYVGEQRALLLFIMRRSVGGFLPERRRSFDNIHAFFVPILHDRLQRLVVNVIARAALQRWVCALKEEKHRPFRGLWS